MAAACNEKGQLPAAPAYLVERAHAKGVDEHVPCNCTEVLKEGALAQSLARELPVPMPLDWSKATCGCALLLAASGAHSHHKEGRGQRARLAAQDRCGLLKTAQQATAQGSEQENDCARQSRCCTRCPGRSNDASRAWALPRAPCRANGTWVCGGVCSECTELMSPQQMGLAWTARVGRRGLGRACHTCKARRGFLMCWLIHFTKCCKTASGDLPT